MQSWTAEPSPSFYDVRFDAAGPLAAFPAPEVEEPAKPKGGASQSPATANAPEGPVAPQPEVAGKPLTPKQRRIMKWLLHLYQGGPGLDLWDMMRVRLAEEAKVNVSRPALGRVLSQMPGEWRENRLAVSISLKKSLNKSRSRDKRS